MTGESFLVRVTFNLASNPEIHLASKILPSAGKYAFVNLQNFYVLEIISFRQDFDYDFAVFLSHEEMEPLLKLGTDIWRLAVIHP
jgi:hypothetical protein